MDGVALAARVVEVIADQGVGSPVRFRYGSGCRVSGKLVLTAAHVVAGSASIAIRGPDKKQMPATRVLVGDPGGVDLALIEVDSDLGDVPQMPMAVVNRASLGAAVVERCHAIGYPEFRDFPGPDGASVRETADAYGEIPVLSGLVRGLLTLQVSSAPKNLPDAAVTLAESQWAGMSGAPVVAGEYLVGVVSEHAPREGDSAITVTPLSQLDPDPQRSWAGVSDPELWWTRLGAPQGALSLHRLPKSEKRATRPYLSTVREIRMRTPQLIGRQHELAEIAAFAVGSDGYRWMVGNAWAGKTALAAEAMVTAMPPEVDVVAYFLSRRESDADSNHFLAVLVPQLAFLVGEEPSPAPDRHAFLRLWEEAVEAARNQERHLLLIVDGLDEDLRPPDSPSVAARLPIKAGGHGHVLVTSRPYPELPIDVSFPHPLRQARPVTLDATKAAEEQQFLAMQEIAGLLTTRSDLAIEVLRTMAAAAGPLAADDLDALIPGASITSLHQFLDNAASRTVQRVGPKGAERYQFAHETLLATCQERNDLDIGSRRQEIHAWGQRWQDADWPTPVGQKGTTPRYLIDAYPSTLKDEPERLVALVSDVGWIAAGVQAVGIDRVLADLGATQSATPVGKRVATLLSALRAQAPCLRPPQPVAQPGYVLRQLCMQAAELSDAGLVADIGTRLQAPQMKLSPIPRWATRRASRALSLELGSHSGRVRTVTVLPDGRVVTGGDDSRVRAWDPAGVASPVELVGHSGVVRAVAALPDGRIASAGDDRRVLLWDLNAVNAPVELGRHGRVVRALAVLPDGRLVSAGDDWRVLLWDPRKVNAAPVGLNGHRGSVRAVAALPDGRIASAGDDRRVFLWNVTSTHAARVELGGHDGVVRALSVLPDGRVISGGEDRRVRVWDPSTAKTVDGAADNDDTFTAATLFPDGRVVSGGFDGRVLIWDAARDDASPIEIGRHNRAVGAVVLLPDGRVVSGGFDGRVLIWDAARDDASPIEIGRHSRGVRAIALLPDGKVVSGGEDRRVLIWDPVPASPARLALPLELGRHRRGVAAVAVLPDGRVISGSEDGRILMWNPGAERRDPIELGRHSGEVRAVSVLPDGRVVSGGEDRRVRIWDPARPGIAPVEVGRHDGVVLTLVTLSDGRVISGGGERSVRVWDVLTRTECARISCSVVMLAAARSPGVDASQLVIAHEGSGMSIWSIPHHLWHRRYSSARLDEDRVHRDR